MPVLNSMMNVMPQKCQYCMQGYWSQTHVSAAAELAGIYNIEMIGSQANKSPIWTALASYDTVFVNHFGHGNADVTTGDDTQPIWTTNSCSNLAGRIVHFLSCKTAINLGPAIIANGGVAYAGYNISWTWTTEDVNADPYELFIAEAFYRSANEFPIALIQGDPVYVAEARCLAKYDEWINIWETDPEHYNHPSAAGVIKWLLYDKKGLKVEGDKSATIVHSGIPVSLSVNTPPPEQTYSSAEFTTDGYVLEKESATPVPNQIVELKETGTDPPLMNTTTNVDGEWDMVTTLGKGIYNLYYFSPYSDTYGSSFSDVYRLGVGETVMETIAQPESHIEIGEATIFSGRLVDKVTGLGIPNKDIYALDWHTTTESDGYWKFSLHFMEAGRYKVSATFPGTADLMESSVGPYMVGAGMLPIIGCDEVGSIGKASVGMIMGSVFPVKEDGVIPTIAVHLEKSLGESVKIRCAVYDRATLGLLGVTEEKAFAPDESFNKWALLACESSINVEAGTDIVLVAWHDLPITMRFNKTGDTKQGMESPIIGYSGNFPETLPVMLWRDARYSIYAEYTKKEEPMPENTITILMDANKTVTAVFKPTTPIQYTLNIGVEGEGTTDPLPGSYQYNSGTEVTVTATPQPGWEFDTWVVV